MIAIVLVSSSMTFGTFSFAVSDVYKKGWNMACDDDMSMTQFNVTAPHSKEFTNGYMDARSSDGPCPY
jgi:hypothetical protein